MTSGRGFTDLRRQVRRPYRGRVSVFWETSGGEVGQGWGRAKDVSENGVQLELTSSVPCGGYIEVRLEELNFSAFGVVRHSDSRCVTGVELRTETAEPEQLVRWREFTAVRE